MNKCVKNIILEEVKLFEAVKNISDNEIIIDAGTELYHGTVEEFDIKNLRVGGYDRLFWTTTSSAIAQTYIPTAGVHIFTSSEHISMPTEDPTMQNIQRQFGIEYDYSQVKFEGHRATSYPTAPVFKENNDKHYKLQELGYQKYLELKKYEEMSKTANDEELTDDFFKKYEQVENEYRNYYDTANQQYNIKRFQNNYVNEKLEALGYKHTGYDDNYNLNFGWKISIDNDQLQPADYRTQGRLIIITPKRNFKILDTTNRGRREGDLTDLDYHKHDWFEQAQKNGYDGIKINDFAQSTDMGNVGHTSIGLFQNTLRDVNAEEIQAQHPNLSPHYQSGDWQSQEYKARSNVPSTVQEDVSEHNKSAFSEVPDELFNKIKMRKYSDTDNRRHLKLFKAKDGREFLIRKRINDDVFNIYSLDDLNNPIASAAFDVHMGDYFTGYEHNQSIQVKPDFRRIGLATAITDFAEQFYYLPYKPTNLLSSEMQGFVQNRFN